MRISNKENRTNTHDTVRLVRDVLGLKSIEQAKKFIENIDILTEYLSDYLQLPDDEKVKVVSIDIGEYITFEKRRKRKIENWRMPNGEIITRPEKVLFTIKFREKGKNLHNIQF